MKFVDAEAALDRPAASLYDRARMGDRETSMGGGGAGFPTTHWSVLINLKDRDEPRSQSHLDELIRAYWRPVYFFIRHAWRKDVETAKDLTQEFFARFLEKEYFLVASRERGSFRSYVKVALRHFLVSADRYQRRHKRAPPQRPLPFEDADAAFVRSGWAESPATPEEILDRQWARTVLMEAVESLEESLEAQDRVSLDVARAYYGLEGDASATAPTYEQIAARFALTEDAVRHHLRATRERLRELLLERIRRYVDGETQARAELAELLGS